MNELMMLGSENDHYHDCRSSISYLNGMGLIADTVSSSIRIGQIEQ